MELEVNDLINMPIPRPYEIERKLSSTKHERNLFLKVVAAKLNVSHITLKRYVKDILGIKLRQSHRKYRIPI